MTNIDIASKVAGCAECKKRECLRNKNITIGCAVFLIHQCKIFEAALKATELCYEQGRQAFCKVHCLNLHLDTCRSLGTCTNYDEFSKFMIDVENQGK